MDCLSIFYIRISFQITFSITWSYNQFFYERLLSVRVCNVQHCCNGCFSSVLDIPDTYYIIVSYRAILIWFEIKSVCLVRCQWHQLRSSRKNWELKIMKNKLEGIFEATRGGALGKASFAARPQQTERKLVSLVNFISLVKL